MFLDNGRHVSDASLSCCFYTSFLFLINVVVCLLYQDPPEIYALLFFALFTTSIIFHGSQSEDIHILWRSSLMILDKISIIGVVLYGGYVFFRKSLCGCGWIDEVKILHISCIIYTFVLTIYLYYFGFLHKKYCFHENKMVANIWHSFLHLVSCIGHILIVLL